MSIEFRKVNNFRLSVIDNHLVGSIFNSSQGIWFEAIDDDQEFSIKQLENILAKMKELQNEVKK